MAITLKDILCRWLADMESKHSIGCVDLQVENTKSSRNKYICQKDFVGLNFFFTNLKGKDDCYDDLVLITFVK